MTKADLVRIVYEAHGGISHGEAKNVVETIFNTVKTRLVSGENVKLSGFGSLKVIQRKGRLGRNPQTGDRMVLNSSRYVTFKPSRVLKF